MTRLLMRVEGQSEEIFVKQTLAPHLADHGVFVQPLVLWTKRLALVVVIAVGRPTGTIRPYVPLARTLMIG